jgi:hypothetical protein
MSGRKQDFHSLGVRVRMHYGNPCTRIVNTKFNIGFYISWISSFVDNIYVLSFPNGSLWHWFRMMKLKKKFKKFSLVHSLCVWSPFLCFIEICCEKFSFSGIFLFVWVKLGECQWFLVCCMKTSDSLILWYILNCVYICSPSYDFSFKQKYSWRTPLCLLSVWMVDSMVH